MKKLTIGGLMAMGIFAVTSLQAQPVSDHVVIPIGVTLVQIARINVNEGGNIEFVFNTIEDYKNGISNTEGGTAATDQTSAAGFYQTQIEFASSHSWSILMGVEEDLVAGNSYFIGTDDPTNSNDFDINHVGFTLDWTGVYSCCNTAGTDDVAPGSVGNTHDAVTPAGAAGDPNGLQLFSLSQAGPDYIFTTGSTSLGADVGGDVLDLNFIINWECGTTNTAGTTPMNSTSILGDNIEPDRYVGNVYLDLNVLGP